MPSVEFAYNSTTSIPSVGSQRKTYNVVIADDSKFRVEGERHDIIDYSRRRDVDKVTLILKVKVGPGILCKTVDRDWFRSFFYAKHRWIVYGNFKDTANSGNNNLCKCDPVEDEIEINVEYDRENGYVFESENVF